MLLSRLVLSALYLHQYLLPTQHTPSLTLPSHNTITTIHRLVFFFIPKGPLCCVSHFTHRFRFSPSVCFYLFFLLVPYLKSPLSITHSTTILSLSPSYYTSARSLLLQQSLHIKQLLPPPYLSLYQPLVYLYSFQLGIRLCINLSYSQVIL